MDNGTRDEVLYLLQRIANQVGELATMGHANRYNDNGDAINKTANYLEDTILTAMKAIKQLGDN